MARASASLLAASVAAAVLSLAAPAYAAAPPTPVTGLTATPADSQVTLRWTNPADADLAGVTIVVKEGAVPTGAADGTAKEVAAPATSTVVTGLANGTSYGFAVFTRNTAGDLSDPSSITSSPVPALSTTLAALASRPGVTYGGTVTLTASLRRADTKEGLEGEPVDVYRKVAGQSDFSRVYRLKTNATGIATYTSLPLGKNTQWYLAHPPNPVLNDSKSATLTTLVRPRLGARISAYAVEQNVPSVATLTVTPNHAGQLVSLQLWTSKGWSGVASRVLSSTSTATFAITSSTVGTRVFRFAKSADSDHAAAVTTKFGITVVPRTLRAGMSGADVLAVQRRLAALHYDVGIANGYFGFDTVHATAAFQKVNRLPVTGAVDTLTHARLANPVAPPLRYKQSGSWIEADLTRQVLYYGRAGTVLRILDISSGSGQLFTVDGETQRAVTPTGSFRIFHKIDGMRVSRLGELWRPAYFAQGGYAIHGNGSVPFYPASHGCIRITVPAMNRMFSMLQIGMPVYVYRS
ncbi:MAG TPA: L,D-transpeptidase family protein [Mycobacteriales bacterium]|jgi:peptidoglycan hydrolase-like protein with peptidoglycan-binding domain|nr:L,D-transpeptidase family protein [Mycobacteriales bacterium]